MKCFTSEVTPCGSLKKRVCDDKSKDQINKIVNYNFCFALEGCDTDFIMDKGDEFKI